MSCPVGALHSEWARNVLRTVLVVVFFAWIASATQQGGANGAPPRVLEEKFDFPPPIQWKLSDIELSVIGLAWGPADSPEMIAKGRDVPSREKPAFFPDKSYALAVHFRAYRPQLNQALTQSQLARIHRR
jgi:hypothetical protein